MNIFMLKYACTCRSKAGEVVMYRVSREIEGINWGGEIRKILFIFILEFIWRPLGISIHVALINIPTPSIICYLF